VDDPFDWQVTKDGRVRVFRGGREVVVLGGARADKLVAELAAADDAGAQQTLARATGIDKRGNEKRPTRS
jgi:hypothetical protein